MPTATGADKRFVTAGGAVSFLAAHYQRERRATSRRAVARHTISSLTCRVIGLTQRLRRARHRRSTAITTMAARRSSAAPKMLLPVAE